MGEALILETTFLVDLEREARGGAPGRAHAFLEAHPDRPLCITLATAGELACGPRVEDREAWRRLVSRFRILTADLDASWFYGQTFRYLADNGLLTWSSFDAGKDALDFNQSKLGESEWLAKLKKLRGITVDEVFSEIRARGIAKQRLVDLKNKLGLPELLEAENSVTAHAKYLLLREMQIQENGGVDHELLLKNWGSWVDDSLVRELQRRRG